MIMGQLQYGPFRHRHHLLWHVDADLIARLALEVCNANTRLGSRDHLRRRNNDPLFWIRTPTNCLRGIGPICLYRNAPSSPMVSFRISP